MQVEEQCEHTQGRMLVESRRCEGALGWMPVDVGIPTEGEWEEIY